MGKLLHACVLVRLTQQVGPDVARFCVDSEDALEARSERGHWGSVPVQKEVVVLQPIREHVVRNDTPSALPHLTQREREKVIRRSQ